MRYGFILIIALSLAGCKNAAAKADDEYTFLSQNGGSPAELCEAAKKARDAWAAAQNDERYKEKKLTADIHCALDSVSYLNR